jgi:MerR family transcriptional regulator, thiopeptide resistance regulator
MLTVGSLAKASGLTVRTLHHWDALGLLAPSERSGAGYRRYGPDEVARLYRILALRRLGLSLEEIAGVLEGSDLTTSVREHLARVEEALATQRRLRDRLVSILDVLDADGEPSINQLIDTIEVMTMHERYYTPEQLEQLSRRADALGEDGMRKAQQDWADLLAEVEAERVKGTDPGDARMRELAGRWQALIEQFTGGDPEMAASLKQMYESEGPEKASRGAVSPELMAYAGEAMRRRSG